MINAISHQGNENQNYNVMPSHPVRMPLSKKKKVTLWQGGKKN
jgi:hypothetical protein